MTCIVAVEDGRRVWMGGDSAVTAGDLCIRDCSDKVWRCGEFVMGAAGSARACSAFRYSFAPPEPPPRVAQFERYFATGFVDEIRKVFDALAVPYDTKAQSDDQEWEFLVGIRGHVYTVDSSLYAGRSRSGYASIGCGAQPALGALHALGSDLTGEQRVRLALAASAEFCLGVSEPFTIVNT